MKTKVLDKSQFQEITELIRDSQVVAFPTDTVYGLGIRYDSEVAVKRLKEAKQRDANKPFPLMVSNIAQIDQVAYLDSAYSEVVKHLMPGALTIIVKKKTVIPDYATNGKNTIAIRMPDDKFVLELLEELGPLLVTSANMSGEKAANDESEVLQQLDGRIAAVVKGHSLSSIPSTIVDLTDKQIKILRQGEITLGKIESYLKEKS